MAKVSTKAVERLSRYRRALLNERAALKSNIFSHDLARLSGFSAAQVRRDVMEIGYQGSPSHGYVVDDLLDSISAFLDSRKGQDVVLVGIGNLGRAILDYLVDRRPKLELCAAFDTNPKKVNRVIHGVRCYPMEQLSHFVAEKNVALGVVSVPVDQAQDVADVLIQAGIRGILNFAPVHLHAPKNVYIEDCDITVALEKVAFLIKDDQQSSLR